MVVYITYIILHYFENAIDIWSFTTLQNIIDCVSNTFLENSNSALHFSVLHFSISQYFLLLYNCRPNHLSIDSCLSLPLVTTATTATTKTEENLNFFVEKLVFF